MYHRRQNYEEIEPMIRDIILLSATYPKVSLYIFILPWSRRWIVCSQFLLKYVDLIFTVETATRHSLSKLHHKVKVPYCYITFQLNLYHNFCLFNTYLTEITLFMLIFTFPVQHTLEQILYDHIQSFVFMITKQLLCFPQPTAMAYFLFLS